MTGASYSNGKVALAVCGRCGLYHAYKKVQGDRNVGPGLRVCREDNDELDPYRLPARAADAMVLRYPRPDTPINTDPNALTGEDNNSFVIGEDDLTYIKPSGAS